jgi:PIN domain nuclease of toxin-antitoxin system
MFYVRGLLQNLHTLLIILCFMFKDFLINLAVLFLYMEVSRKKSPETKKLIHCQMSMMLSILSNFEVVMFYARGLLQNLHTLLIFYVLCLH